MVLVVRYAVDYKESSSWPKLFFSNFYFLGRNSRNRKFFPGGPQNPGIFSGEDFDFLDVFFSGFFFGFSTTSSTTSRSVT